MKAKENKIIGVSVAVVYNVAKQTSRLAKDPEASFSLWELIQDVGIGYFLTSLPDWIEPSINNPRHRKFFHSLTFFVLTTYGITGNRLERLPKELRGPAKTLGITYLAHLGADSTTKFSLSVI